MARAASSYRANGRTTRLAKPDRRELPPAVAKALRRAINRRALHRWDGLAETPAMKIARTAMRHHRRRPRVAA